MRPEFQPELHRSTPDPRPAYNGNPSSALPISGLSKRGQALIGRQRMSISIGPRRDVHADEKLKRSAI